MGTAFLAVLIILGLLLIGGVLVVAAAVVMDFLEDFHDILPLVGCLAAGVILAAAAMFANGLLGIL